jgi:hypothetical protein
MVRHGDDFEHWLNYTMWSVMPDFLTFPDTSRDPTELLRTDLAALRMLLAVAPGQTPIVRDAHTLAAFWRLERHGIITTRRGPTGRWIFCATTYSEEVARANVSCHDGASRNVVL